MIESYCCTISKREDCNYPFKELTGCGIGFKLIQAYAAQSEIDFSNLQTYLDLVAVSIAADIVPIVGENRILAHFGLIELNERPRPGFKAMINCHFFRNKSRSQFRMWYLLLHLALMPPVDWNRETGRLNYYLAKMAQHATISGNNLNSTNTE